MFVSIYLQNTCSTSVAMCSTMSDKRRTVDSHVFKPINYSVAEFRTLCLHALVKAGSKIKCFGLLEAFKNFQNLYFQIAVDEFISF